MYTLPSIATDLAISASQDEPTSTRRPTSAGKPSRNRRSNVYNSEEIDVDVDITIPTVKERTTKAPQQVFKNVVVPINSRSSLGSSLSSVRDLSSEYDTPATSVAGTPAESLVREELASRRLGKLSKSSISSGLSYKSPKGKRKRPEKDELIQTDALLTQASPKEEYEERGSKQSTSRKRRNGRIEDSVDDDPFSSPTVELSTTPAISGIQISKSNSQELTFSRTPLEEASEEDIDDLFTADIAKPKKVKTAQRTTLPSRAARNGAKKSMNDESLHQILDSEDSSLSEDISNVSLFASDLDTGAFEESGDSDTDVDDTFEKSNDPTRSGSAIATASLNPITAQASVPQRRRARATRDANPNRSRRRYGGMEDRVCYAYLPADYTIETNRS